jgi:hypothetical protein
MAIFDPMKLASPTNPPGMNIIIMIMANPKMAMAQGPCKNLSHSGMKVSNEAPMIEPAIDPAPPIISMHMNKIDISTKNVSALTYLVP